MDGRETKVLRLLGLEDRKDSRQRNRVEIVAKAYRGNAIERDFDIVRSEIAQAGCHQPDKTVKHDFQHRQSFIRNHRRVDDGADAGIVVERDIGETEAEQAVNFFLVENAFSASLCGLKSAGVVSHGSPLRGRIIGGRGSGLAPCRSGTRIRLQRWSPPCRERVLVDLVFCRHCLSRLLLFASQHHWTTISLNSTAVMWFGATAALTRRVSSSFRR